LSAGAGGVECVGDLDALIMVHTVLSLGASFFDEALKRTVMDASV
jgi:hypothetical protein